MAERRYFVFITRPAGDYLSGVPADLIEESYTTLSMPPSDATIMFRVGTSKSVAEAAAERAMACGSRRAWVEFREPPGPDE